MKLKIRCIGQKSDSNINQEVQKYLKRITPPFKVEIEIFPHSRAKDAEQQKQEEAKLLLKKIPEKTLLIATAIKGKNYSTEGLQEISEKFDNCIIFIGGCNGLDQSVMDLCRVHWSISNLTLPHPLVRLIVVEQWYRLNCLHKNHPYHK